MSNCSRLHFTYLQFSLSVKLITDFPEKHRMQELNLKDYWVVLLLLKDFNIFSFLIDLYFYLRIS